MKQIKITVKGAALAPIEDFVWFQGELKMLTEENFQKLRKQILKHGFNTAIDVWFDVDIAAGHQPGMNILDGHQRILTCMRMRDEEGYHIPHLPYDVVEAPSYQAAREIVLAKASQFGVITNQGLADFSLKTGIELKQLENDFTLPGIQIADLAALASAPLPELETDKSAYTDEAKDKYDRAIVKAITMHFSNNEYAEVVNRLNLAQEKLGVDDYSQTLIGLLDAFTTVTKKRN